MRMSDRLKTNNKFLNLNHRKDYTLPKQLNQCTDSPSISIRVLIRYPVLISRVGALSSILEWRREFK